jgi:hypothetical protein
MGTLPFALRTLKQALTGRSKLHPPSAQPKPRSEASRFFVRIKSAAPSILSKASRLWLHAVSEQAPNRENRVMLSKSLDRLLVPVVKVKWNIGELEHRTMMRLVESLAAYFLKFGLGTVHIKDHPGFIDYFARESADFYHHAGTTRMSDTPSSGVWTKTAECTVSKICM